MALAGVGLAAAASVAGLAGVAGLIAYLWPRRTSGQIDAGAVADYPVGMVRHFQVSESALQVPPVPLGSVSGARFRDFHLVRRPDGFVAFWHRCTHMGCTVPFRPDFQWPVDGRTEKGLFRCPCHGSTFWRDEADIIFGPAPRPLDTLPVQVSRGRVLVTVSPGRERRREPHEPARVAAA
jgi:Rieske Fe-S protein